MKVHFNKKKSSCEEDSNLNYNSIIAYNNQSRNAITYFFDKNVLKMATKNELIRLSYLADEVPFKWCKDNINQEFLRRAI